jgi:outer membrane protein assembly factor BamA
VIAKVDFTGADGDALREAASAVELHPNMRATRSDILAARNAIVATGLFSAVEPVAKETREGVVIDFKLTQNGPFKGMKISGAKLLPEGIVDDIFEGAEGKTCSQYQYLEARAPLLFNRMCLLLSSSKPWRPEQQR